MKDDSLLTYEKNDAGTQYLAEELGLEIRYQIEPSLTL